MSQVWAVELRFPWRSPRERRTLERRLVRAGLQGSVDSVFVHDAAPFLGWFGNISLVGETPEKAHARLAEEFGCYESFWNGGDGTPIKRFGTA